MSQGIVCKIWNVSGSTRMRSTASNLNDSINYIMNEEKTSKYLDGNDMPDAASQIDRETQYIVNDLKTMKGALVGGRLITDLDKASKEMMQVKRQYNKEDGRCALHGVISLEEEDSDIKNAPKLLMLANNVLCELFPEHQAVFAVHTNTENLHVHFIVNSVGLNGRKINQPRSFVRKQLHPVIAAYARKYGFTVNPKWENEPDYSKKMSFKQEKTIMRAAIYEAIENASSLEEFKNYLEEDGWSVSLGMHITMQNDLMTKRRRIDTLFGKDFLPERIVYKMEHKYDELETDTIDEFVTAHKNVPGTMIYTTPPKMKKFKDMSDKEKKDVIRLLKLGRNPWAEYYNYNWAVQQRIERANADTRIKILVRDYAPNENLEAALNQIIERKNGLAEQKAKITNNIRTNRSLINLYKKAKGIQMKAYLYEFGRRQEYKDEYEEFAELQRRMQDGYHKTFIEVAEWYENQQNQLAYAKAQDAELGKDYRQILRYGRRYNLISENIGCLSLYDAVNFKANEERVQESRSMDKTVKFITGKNDTRTFIKVEYDPYMDEKWQLHLAAKATLYDSSTGEKIDSIDTRECENIHEFNEWLHHVEGCLDYNNCMVANSQAEIEQFISEHPTKALSMTEKTEIKQQKTDKTHNLRTMDKSTNQKNEDYSFFAAIYPSKRELTHYFVNTNNPKFYGVADYSEDGVIKVSIMDMNGQILNGCTISSGEWGKDTYTLLDDMRAMYGFSKESVSIFSDEKEMKEYIHAEADRHAKEVQEDAKATDKATDIKNITNPVSKSR